MIHHPNELKTKKRGRIKTDRVEKSIKYLLIKRKLEKEIIAEIGDRRKYPPCSGYCHLYWCVKERILKEKYHIDWLSPAELNPDVRFD